jgi:hypothetical protein
MSYKFLGNDLIRLFIPMYRVSILCCKMSDQLRREKISPAIEVFEAPF